MDSLGILLSGLLLGLTHAFDADHIAAISAIVTETRRPLKAIRVGALWGLGHATSIFAVGLLVIGGKLAVPPGLPRIFEAGVGAMLVFLGARVLKMSGRSAEESGLHKHPHEPRRDMVSFLVGLAHGLAGSGAITLLILATISEPRTALAYLAVFGGGATASMSVLSFLMARPLAMWTSPAHRYGRWVQRGVGTYALALGAFMFVSQTVLPVFAKP